MIWIQKLFPKLIMELFLRYLKHIGNELTRRREETILSLLPKGKEIRYLDLGCEDGRLTLERANKIGTGSIYGVEIMDSVIKKARQKGIIVKKADLNGKIPFPNKSFDVITATQVIEHLYNIDALVSEVYRILKSGGIFIVSTENLSAWHNIFALLLGLQPSVGPFISSKFSIGFHPLYKEHIKDHKDIPHLALMSGHTRVMAYNSFKKLFKLYKFKFLSEKTVGYYPFPGVFSNWLSSLDKWHSVDMILKLKK